MITENDYLRNFEEKDCYTISFSQLMEHEPRWANVLDDFRNACNKPNHIIDFNEMKDKLIESRMYPIIEKVEAEDRIKSIQPPNENGWMCLTKYGHVGRGNDPIFNKITSICNHLSKISGTMYSVQPRGFFYYPPGAFHNWHTNQYHEHGWRLYMIGVPHGGDSSFFYVDRKTKELREVKDRDATINLFRVGSKNDKLYHSASSLTAERWSMGFKVDDMFIYKLLNRFFPNKG